MWEGRNYPSDDPNLFHGWVEDWRRYMLRLLRLQHLSGKAMAHDVGYGGQERWTTRNQRMIRGLGLLVHVNLAVKALDDGN